MSEVKPDKHIPLSSIAAVQWKPAGRVVDGFIEFTVPGDAEGRAAPASHTYQASADNNAVLFTKRQMKDFQALRIAIEDARRRPSAPPPPDTTP
jgi:hypothetical protein